jgi:hypothetical protein
MWNYPFALAMVSLYAWVFFGAKLYSDALLQFFYIAVNLYGWWNWARSRAEPAKCASSSSATPAARLARGLRRRIDAVGCADASLHRCRLPVVGRQHRDVQHRGADSPVAPQMGKLGAVDRSSISPRCRYSP